MDYVCVFFYSRRENVCMYVSVFVCSRLVRVIRIYFKGGGLNGD